MTDAPETDVVHRLRNHIAVIVSFSELLLEATGKDDPRRADIEEIHRAAMAALAIVPAVAAQAAVPRRS